MHILLVDDHQVDLYMLEVLLRGHGFTVSVASDGMTALEQLARGGIDLIITDILMPRMDGFQFYRTVKTAPHLCHIPLIFYTATYTDPEDEAFAVRLGAARFVAKPAAPEVLLATVQEVLQEHQASAHPMSSAEVTEETAYLHAYNARLVHKLEDKLQELEAANASLRASEERYRITERKHLEEKLRQGQKLEALGTLVSGIAHDFNSILMAIMGHAELLREKMSQAHPVWYHVQDILTAASRGKNLVGQMGLAVVHGIVSEHGETITVESTPGHGTLCAVYLPRGPEAPLEAAEPYVPPPKGMERIAFVDDEEDLIYLAQEVLTRLGYEPVVFTSSPDALAAFRAEPHRFDLVITDQNMPIMSGDVLIQELRRIRADIPIILCTGFGYHMAPSQVQALGINVILTKPWTIHDLALAIRRCLD